MLIVLAVRQSLGPVRPYRGNKSLHAGLPHDFDVRYTTVFFLIRTDAHGR